MSKTTYKAHQDTLIKDVRAMNEYLRNHGKANEFLELGKPSLSLALFVICLNWALVFISVSLVFFHSVWWLPIAMIVIGSRQRALVVLTHDASHFLLAKNRYINDLIANVFLCLPMAKSLKYYRAIHLPHHMNLGDKVKDTDYLHDPEGMKRGWLHVYLKHLLSYDLWAVAEFEQTFRKISKRHVFCLFLWWGVALAALSVFIGTAYAGVFVALWLFSRAITYHVITTFIIISDHNGLFPGTILGYTRNHPSCGLLRWLIHPHNNGLHLVHHLAPFVPFYNLNKAHKLLQNWDRYASAEQCETYFWGKKSVISSWGKCIIDKKSIRAFDAQPAFEALNAILEEDAIYSFEQGVEPEREGRRVA